MVVGHLVEEISDPWWAQYVLLVRVLKASLIIESENFYLLLKFGDGS